MPKVDDKEYPYTKEGMEEADAEKMKGAAMKALGRLADKLDNGQIQGLSVKLMFAPEEGNMTPKTPKSHKKGKDEEDGSYSK